jgi:ribonuclease P protein component
VGDGLSPEGEGKEDLGFRWLNVVALVRDERLRRRERITRRVEFSRVLDDGCRIPGELFTLFILQNDLGYHRFGVIVGRNLGKIARRNLAKRRLKEAFRRSKPKGTLNLDIVAIGKKPILERKTERVKEELKGKIAYFLRSRGVTGPLWEESP